MKINEAVFKEYDLRGIVDKDLSDEFSELLGKAFGTYLLKRGTKDVIVGRDTRASSPSYQKNVEKGLMSTGCNVYDIGIVITSTAYFARHHYRIDGAVYVTASHNPPQYNGFKLCSGLNTISGAEIEEVKEIMLSGKFKTGKGDYKELQDANKAYYDAIRQRIKLKKKLKVVVDSGNGTTGLFVPEFLKSIGCEVVELYTDIDPNYPNHIPDPVYLDAYKELIKTVKETKADVGILFDGDGDRVGFTDEKGRIWVGDIIFILLIRDMLPKHPGAKVIVELKDSELVVDEVKRLGGIPIFWKTGHPLLDKKVAEEKALMCGEMSCHYWITENWYVFDDAVFALSHMLRIISNSEKKFSEMIDELPLYHVTPEYRISAPEDKKFQIVKEVTNYFKKVCKKYVDIDGIRGYLEDGWFLFRASNTQPMVIVRCEAKTKEGLEKIKKIVKAKLDEYPEINLDWNRQYDKV